MAAAYCSDSGCCRGWREGLAGGGEQRCAITVICVAWVQGGTAKERCNVCLVCVLYYFFPRIDSGRIKKSGSIAEAVVVVVEVIVCVKQ